MKICLFLLVMIPPLPAISGHIDENLSNEHIILSCKWMELVIGNNKVMAFVCIPKSYFQNNWSN